MEFLAGLLASTLTMSTPVAFAAVGGAMSARGGVQPFGLEGMMVVGAFCGVLGSYLSGSAVTGVFCGILGGALMGGLRAMLCVHFRINQVISGIGLNILGLSLTTLFMQLIWGHKGNSPLVAGIGRVGGGALAEVSVLGRALGSQSVLFYIMLAVVVLSWLILFKTRFGLRLRMVGEHPAAAQSRGVPVGRLKYLCVVFCGAVSGLGGVCLSLDQLNLFSREMTGGIGYIALAVAVVSGYNPGRVLPWALAFGFFDALQIHIHGTAMPIQLLQMLPYVAVVVILFFGTRNLRVPQGLGLYEN